jgi:hypothetical protein
MPACWKRALPLLSRIAGFGLCLVGAFIAGYYQSLHATSLAVAAPLYNFIDLPNYAPGFYAAVSAQVNAYIQQNVDANWIVYLALGILIAIIGSLVIALDPKPKPAKVTKTAVAEPLRVEQKD